MSKREKRKSLYTESFSSALDDRKDPRVFIQRVAKLLGIHGNSLIQWAKSMDDSELGDSIEKILNGGCSDEWIFLFCSTGSTGTPEVLPPGTANSRRRSNTGSVGGCSGSSSEETEEGAERPVGAEITLMIDRIVRDITSSILSHTGSIFILKGGACTGKSTILREINYRLKRDYAITPSNWRTVHSQGTIGTNMLQMLYMDDADLESFEKPVENLVVKYYRNAKNVMFFTCKDSSKFQSIIDSCGAKIYNIPDVRESELITILERYSVRNMKVSKKAATSIVNVMNAVGTSEPISKGIEVIRDLLYQKLLDQYMVDGDVLPEIKKICNYTVDEVKLSVSRVIGVKILQSTECTPEMLKQKFSKIRGQDHVIDAIVPLVSTVVSGLSDPERPAGVILLYGPPGTGKTEIGKVIAKDVLQCPIHVEDMNTYSEKHSVSRITGAPPGYLGYNDPPAIMDFIDTNKRGVLILSEIEKAHETVRDHILELIDTGMMRDTRGKLHDARRFVIIMTSNVTYGKQYETKSIGFGEKKKVHHTVNYRDEIKQSGLFKDEFVSRIQVISRFNDLNYDSIQVISSNMLDELEARLNSVGVKLKKKLKKELIEDIQAKFASSHGAREMKTYIETVIKDRIVKGSRL